MKIAHVYKKHYDSGDGITNVVENLYNLQKNNNVDKYIDLPFTFDNRGKGKAQYRYSGFIGMLCYLFKYKPDVVYLHGFYYLHYLILGICFLFLKSKVVLVPHCALLNRSIAYKKLRKLIYFQVFSFMYRYLIILIQYLNHKEQIGSKKLPFSPPESIIPNGVNYTEKQCRSFDILSMFYLGRCDINHKGIDILFEYFSKLDQKIKLYGADSNEKLKLKKLINLGNLEQKIKIYGPVFNQDKEGVFLNNNIFVLLSRYEGLPISILEALSYGCICLVSTGTNMADEIVTANCGFKIDTIDDFVSAWNKLQTMSIHDLEVMSNNSKALIKHKYTWQKVIVSSEVELRKYMPH
ncbi:glycosyltransferase [Escherichia albertii]